MTDRAIRMSAIIPDRWYESQRGSARLDPSPGAGPRTPARPPNPARSDKRGLWVGEVVSPAARRACPLAGVTPSWTTGVTLVPRVPSGSSSACLSPVREANSFYEDESSQLPPDGIGLGSLAPVRVFGSPLFLLRESAATDLALGGVVVARLVAGPRLPRFLLAAGLHFLLPSSPRPPGPRRAPAHPERRACGPGLAG